MLDTSHIAAGRKEKLSLAGRHRLQRHLRRSTLHSPRPRMTVVAGPPGSGKSSRFPLSSFNVDWFNADDRAAELNLGSFRKISAEIRAKVNLEFQRWILDHVSSHQSFAIETTLRSPITFEQARLAREHGFWTAME